MNKVAIYHFTDGSEKRPIVNEKQMIALREFASHYGTVVKEYLDKSLKKGEQEEKKKLFQEIGKYNRLITKDFYHIAKNTGTCIGIMQKFFSIGVKIYSMEDGSFTFTETPFDQELNIAVYHSKYADNAPSAEGRKRGNSITVQTQIEIIKLFVKTKTRWKIIDVYVDETEGQSDDKQKNLLQLIENKNKYDLVLCKDFNRIHWRTAKFCERRNKMGLDIYSLKEGYLKYERSDLYERR